MRAARSDPLRAGHIDLLNLVPAARFSRQLVTGSAHAGRRRPTRPVRRPVSSKCRSRTKNKPPGACLPRSFRPQPGTSRAPSSAAGNARSRGGTPRRRLLLAWRAGDRLRVQRPPARSRVRGRESGTDESIRVSSVRPAAIGSCPRSTNRRRRRPAVQATRTAEALGQRFHLPVRREPGRRPLRAGPELRGRVG